MKLIDWLRSKIQRRTLDIPIRGYRPVQAIVNQPLIENNTLSSPNISRDEGWHSRNDINNDNQMPSASLVFAPRQRVAEDFVVETQLGAGGMGTAYLAHHSGWGIDVVLKVPHQEIIRDINQCRLITREAEAWTDLGLHPNIVYCYCVLMIEEVPVIVMEYLDGGSLRDWLDVDRSFQSKLNAAIQLSIGVAHAHSCGMLHRDLNPDNVLLAVDGTLKITDFGLTRAISHSESQSIVSADSYTPSSHTIFGLGRYEYMPPESFDKNAKIDFRTDIFALGVCLYELFCGIHPYGGINRGIPRRAVDPTTLKQCSMLPQQLCHLLQRCVEWDAIERLDSVHNIAEILASVYAEAFSEASPFINLPPTNPEADGLNNRGVTYVQLKRTADAQSSFDAALKTNPHHLEATFNKSLLQWRSGELDEITGPSSLLEQLRMIAEVSQTKVAIAVAELYQDMHDPDAARTELSFSSGLYDSMFANGDSSPVRRRKNLTALGSRDITSVALSCDGATVLYSGGENSWRAERLYSGDSAQFKSAGGVQCLGVSANGETAVVGLENGCTEVWDLTNGTRRGSMGRPELHNEVSSLALSSDGRTCIWGVRSGHLYVADSRSLSIRRVINLHQSMPEFATENLARSVAISADGGIGLSAGGRSIRVWNLSSGRCVQSMDDPEICSDVFLSPDGKRAFTGSWSGKAKVWSLSDGKIELTLSSHSTRRIAVDPTFRWALTGGRGVILWDLVATQRIRILAAAERGIPGHPPRAPIVALAKNAAVIAKGSWLEVWDVDLSRRYRPRWKLCKPARISDLESEAEARRKALRQVTTLWNSGKFQECHDEFFAEWSKVGFRHEAQFTNFYEMISRRFPANVIRMAKAAFAIENVSDGFTIDPKGTRLLTWYHPKQKSKIEGGGEAKLPLRLSESREVSTWNISDGRKLESFDAKEFLAFANCAAFTPDASRALIADARCRLVLWDRMIGLRTLETSRDTHQFVAISPEGRLGVSGGAWSEHIVKVWDLRRGTVIRIFKQHVKGAAISPDERFLGLFVSNTLQLWNIREDQLVRSINVTSQEIESVALTENATHALVACYQVTTPTVHKGAIEFWNLGCSTCLKSIALDVRPGAVAIAPEGGWAVSVLRENPYTEGANTWVFWDLIWDRQVKLLTSEADADVTGIKMLVRRRDWLAASARLADLWSTAPEKVTCDLDSSYSLLLSTLRRREVFGLSFRRHVRLEDSSSVVAVNSRGSRILAVARESILGRARMEIKRWNVATGRSFKHSRSEEISGKPIAMSQDCRHFLFSEGSSGLLFRTPSEAESINVLPRYHPSAAMSADGHWIAAIQYMQVYIFGTRPFAIRSHINLSGYPNSVAISADGGTVALAYGAKLELWNSSTGKLVAEKEIFSCETTIAMALADGGRWIFLGMGSHIAIWDTQSESIRGLTALDGFVRAVCVTPDLSWLCAVTSSQKSIDSAHFAHIWRVLWNLS